ncbi:hypothetical protein F5X99DRAFT_398461 [Biscogniauxia marginata]|nr:hypothetical protein F5X99DRAFT_398461 [Biscogniauxia marginata]
MGAESYLAANPPNQFSRSDELGATNVNPDKSFAPYNCRECHESFKYGSELQHHARQTSLGAFVCDYLDCDEAFAPRDLLWTHKHTPHVSGHHRVNGHPTLFACAECNESFKSQEELQLHGHTRQHSPFACSCGAKYVRIDVFDRHIKSLSKDGPRYPCSFCRRYRGKHGFRRRDHLVQHLRGYHKLDEEEIEKACPKERSSAFRQILTCPYQGCESYREESFCTLSQEEQVAQRPFNKQADYSKHMKEVHKETPFPCTVAGCDRVRAKGYMRENDFMKHLADKHPEAPQHVPEARD